MKTPFFLLLTCILFMASCHTTNNPHLTKISQADLSHPVDKLSDIIQDIDFVKIEDGQFYTNLAADLILLDGKSRRNFKAYASGYLLLNPENQIDVYNTEGKFRFTFGESGKGPGEYTRIDDFCYDPFHHCYYIASPSGLYTYDSTGSWQHTHKWPDDLPLVDQMEVSSSSTLIAGGAIRTSTGLYPYFTFDTTANICAVHCYSNSLKKPHINLSYYHDHFYCILNDSIFRVSDDSLSLHRCFQFNKDKPFSLLFYNENNNYGLLHAAAGNIPEIEYLYLLLSKQDKNKFYLISSKTQDDCFLNLNRGVYGFVLDAWSVVNDKLLITIPATEFRDLVEKAKKNPGKYPYFEKARQVAEGLTDDSNSVIAWVTLKEI